MSGSPRTAPELVLTSVNLAGVEIILNMREHIEQMQGEVNEFMQYVKREMAKGLGNWKQRLGASIPSALYAVAAVSLLQVGAPGTHAALTLRRRHRRDLDLDPPPKSRFTWAA